MAAGYFPSGRAGGRRRQKDTMLLTLLLPLAHHVARLPNKPPVTLGLVARASAALSMLLCLCGSLVAWVSIFTMQHSRPVTHN
jgi:hypothetical protein